MKYRILILICLSIGNYCWSQETDTIKIDKAFYLSDFSVSIINLISSPDKYHNQRIRVIGYLNLEFEGNSIYLHKEDFKKSIYANGLWVDFTKEAWAKIEKYNINKCYVIIEGTFDKIDRGHMGLWSGTIKDITRIDKWN